MAARTVPHPMSIDSARYPRLSRIDTPAEKHPAIRVKEREPDIGAIEAGIADVHRCVRAAMTALAGASATPRPRKAPLHREICSIVTG